MIGLTCAQSARDVLRAAGIKQCFNTSKFLSKIERGLPIAPGTLFVVDEGSMVPMGHMARIIDLAEKHDCKVFVTGDHQQLVAVEAGGAMTLLANHLGYTQLAVPVRFTEEWERDASLRLRAGDKTALDAYAEHGRITGGSREEALDLARQAHVAGRLAGEDTLLMAHDRQDCRELSRMIRDDLIHLGLVDDGPSMQLTEGEQTSARDVIVCRDNDSRVETDPGHKLTNGDVFQVESVRGNGAWVRRVLDADPETGRMRLADHAFFYGDSKLRTVTDLAYAVTGHKGMGGTVSIGSAYVTGKEPLEWLYVALTRGRQRNTAIAVTHDGVKDKHGVKAAIQPREADPRPGTRPDPELARRERMERERAGLPPEPAETPADEVRPPIAVLADCMDREDAELSRERVPGPRPGQRRPPGHPALTVGRPGRQSRPRPLPPARRPTPCHPSTGTTTVDRKRPGCAGPYAPPRWPGSTRGRWYGQQSTPGPWQMPAASPPSWMRACGRSLNRWFRCRNDPGPTGHANLLTPR